MNWEKHLATAFYLYGDLTYLIIYRIMGFYKNYLRQSRTTTNNKFNKMMSKLKIKIKYKFAIYQNF